MINIVFLLKFLEDCKLKWLEELMFGGIVEEVYGKFVFNNRKRGWGD